MVKFVAIVTQVSLRFGYRPEVTAETSGGHGRLMGESCIDLTYTLGKDQPIPDPGTRVIVTIEDY